MTNPDLEQLVEIIQKEFKKPGYGNVLWTKIAQAILEAGYVKAEKVCDYPLNRIKAIALSGAISVIFDAGCAKDKNIQVFIREVNREGL